ncbi:MAG: ferritin family protein [bacterium]|nr:MAG: ferritin family protein [bacterium]
MAKILQPAEIVEIGIEKEKKRRDFYALAADRFKDNEELADLFGRLRDWEETHIKRFEEIRDMVSKAQYTESYAGETEAYMQALVQSDLYSDITPDRFANIVKTPADALDMGIRFEKDAILFFNGMSRFVDDKVKEITGKLIEEEQQHMLYLFNLKKEMGL